MRKLAPGLSTLEKKPKAKYLASLDRAGRNADPKWQRALKTFAPKFHLGWAKLNIRERADRLGLQELYDYYRLASLIAHGSAAGSIGLRKNYSSEHVTYRTGAALELAPVALWAGLKGYLAVLEFLQLFVTSNGNLIESAHRWFVIPVFITENMKCLLL